jgi:hypothetical protein
MSFLILLGCLSVLFSLIGLAGARLVAARNNHEPTFQLGDAVVFEPKSFNPEWWDKQSEADLVKWYGRLGYKSERPHVFVYICEINSAPGHCVLVSLQDQHIETMRHTSDFRMATDEEL